MTTTLSKLILKRGLMAAQKDEIPICFTKALRLEQELGDVA